MTAKEQFIQIYTENIKREGADKLLEFLEKSDFFTAPASTRFHGAYEGGLLQHSLNVYECLVDFLSRPRVKERYKLEPTAETTAIVALLHDVCKVNFYTVQMRNAKNEQTGQWEKVPFYAIDDKLPYGHGEKSVYMISGFMRLARGGNGYPLAYGLLRDRGQEHHRQSSRNVPAGVRAVRCRYGGKLLLRGQGREITMS